MLHKLDDILLKLSVKEKFFTQGLGDLHILKEVEQQLNQQFDPIIPDILTVQNKVTAGAVESYIEVKSVSSDLLPETINRAPYLRLSSRYVDTPLANLVVLPATGEQGFSSRTKAYGKLIEQGIDCYFPMLPYYGARKMPGQISHYINTFSDFYLMGFAAAKETAALLELIKAKNDSPVILAGSSMGANLAGLTMKKSSFVDGLFLNVPCTSPLAFFFGGGFRHYCDWEALQQSFASQKTEFDTLESLLEHYLSIPDMCREYSPPDNTFCWLQSAKNDRIVPVEHTYKITHAWDLDLVKQHRGSHLTAMIWGTKTMKMAIAAYCSEKLWDNTFFPDI